MIRLWLFILIEMFVASASTQVWTEDDVIERALNNYPGIRMADLEVARHKSLERTAFNPEQPRFEIEAPTDMGLGFEVEQEFDFPTVYTTRSQWLKSETLLATEAAALTRNELIRDVRLAFLDVQFAQAQYQFYQTQDSLWRDVERKSQRLFDNGEINLADLVFAQKQSGLTSIALRNAITERNNKLARLRTYTGEPVQKVENIEALAISVIDTSSVFYFDKYLQQGIEVEKKEKQVFQSQRLPGLLIGYLKAPEPDTEFRYRFKAGITVPVWQSQYTGEIRAKEAEIEIKETEAHLRRLAAQFTQESLLHTIHQSRESLAWFESEGLSQRDKLVDIYSRLYAAGEVDYAVMLRNVADAFGINDQYLTSLRLHNEAIIQLEYLKGNQ